MAITVTIAGVNRSDYVETTAEGTTGPRISMNYRSSWTAELICVDRLSTSAAFRPALNDTVVIADGATTVFRGWIFSIADEPVVSARIGTRVRVSCRAYDALLDALIVDQVYGTDPLGIANSSVANPTSITTVQPHGLATGNHVTIEGHVGSVAGVNGTHVASVTSHSTFTIPINNTTAGGGGTVRKVVEFGTILTHLHSTYLNARGVSLDTIAAGIHLEKQVYKDVTLRSVFDHLAQVTGWAYRITPEPELEFFSVGTKTTSYSLTAANGLNVGPVTWTQRRQRYVNSVRLRFGSDSTLPKTQVFTGDGSTNVWALDYTPAKDPNGFPVTAGYVADTGAYSPLGMLSDITSSSVANPSTITTLQRHGFEAGASVGVVIQSHSGSTPSINGTHTATITGLNTFTIPVNVTVAGTGGSVYQDGLVWLYYPTTNSLFRVGALASESLAEFTYTAQFPDVVTAVDGAGDWPGLFEAPDIYDVRAAQQLADGLLRRELATPKTVTTQTRQSFIMPGSVITLTFTDRTISGSHLIQSVEATIDADQTIRYTLTAVTGTEFTDTAFDIQQDVFGGGGLQAAGGTITGTLAAGGASGIFLSPVQGTRVTIDKLAEVRLEMHPIEVPDPDPTERRSMEWRTSAGSSALYDVTRQDIDSEVTQEIFYIDRAGGGAATHFGGFGIGTDVAYSAGNYTASSGTWTVDNADEAVRYQFIAYKTMRVTFRILTTDVSATPTELRMLIPGGFTAGESTRGYISVVDAGGTPQLGMVLSTSGDTILRFYKDLTTTTAWTTTAADNTSIAGQFTFEVQ